MFTTRAVLLQLLWLSLASATHFGGGVTHFTTKKISNGRYEVELRHRVTFRGCRYQYGTCRRYGTCGHNSQIQSGVIDFSHSRNTYATGTWCHTESVVTKILTTDTPFDTLEYSCCWVYLNTPSAYPWWSVLTRVDLGTRSDTNAPNNSPATAIVPLLRVPQNCPRTYRPIFIDPENDVVHCRYGNRYAQECGDCRRQVGFQLNEASCSLRYLATGNQGLHGLEFVVEDFPRNNVWLQYSNGQRAYRQATAARKKRWASMATTAPTSWPPTSPPWWWLTAPIINPTVAPTNTTAGPNTTTAATTTTTAAPTTTAPPTTTTTTTARPTTATYWPLTTLPKALPVSVLPLQFLFRVDPPAPSCLDGDYLPRLVSPTPPHGDVVLAEAGRQVEIDVKGEARFSTLDNLVMSGPVNITKHRTTTDMFTIKWTPTEENVGKYFPICFALEFKNGSTVYQSEMRCVAVNVTTDLIHTVVTCKETFMVVEVEKATLPRIHYDQLSLSDSSETSCNLQTHSNSTHVVAIVHLNKCGTQIQEDEENLVFKNEITTVDSNSSVITRRHQVEIQFECEYIKTGNVTFTFSGHRRNVTVWDKGMGTFTYGFEFFTNQNYLNMINARNYPVEYEVGDRIYMEIEATTTVDNTELFAVSCIATPYDIPNYHTTYAIIEDGCHRDSTLIVHPVPHRRMFRFSIEAFKFLGLHDQVFVSCVVMMCEAGNPHSRCSRGCQSGTSRAKRDAPIESGTHYVSQGPLRMKRSVEIAGSTGMNLNLNLIFITGSVLIAVGMICGVIIYKTKKSDVKYRRLPSEE